MHKLLLIILIMTTTLTGAGLSSATGQEIRVAHFLNFTHAQALIGRTNGAFEKSTKSKISWKLFNAGPTAMEALIAGEIDIAYVGPNPAINAYLRSKGKVLKVIAGAANGGASLVVRRGTGIKSVRDFKGKRIASPEIGNTQDVALRTWLNSQGLRVGRDVKVSSLKNPDILQLFIQKELDSAWVPEPWASRLILEGGGEVFLDESSIWPRGEFATALLVVRTDFLQKKPQLVKDFLSAHIDTTIQINRNKSAAKRIINKQLALLMGAPLSTAVLDRAFAKIDFNFAPASSLSASAKAAEALGYLPRSGVRIADVDNITDLTILNQILTSRKLPAVP
ncbi:MAG: ABC transporter substrate-binding protein [Desulfuromonadaceae bacterium]|nr:ABC transporter substrate-binding protein [Desulfuromonadaceae bacterium]MDD2854620.1 ABC transporter substrate-binding protein [Desulfuromonadaceae bacterium]